MGGGRLPEKKASSSRTVMKQRSSLLILRIGKAIFGPAAERRWKCRRRREDVGGKLNSFQSLSYRRFYTTCAKDAFVWKRRKEVAPRQDAKCLARPLLATRLLCGAVLCSCLADNTGPPEIEDLLS